MKKSLLLSILTLLLTLPATVFAAEERVDVDQLRYTVDTDANTAQVYGPISSGEKIHNLVIPDFIDYNGSQIPVTSIRRNAFYNYSGLTGSLTIGDNVTTIGESAFQYCSGLTGSLTIGDSVTTIGIYAFCDCSGFTGSLTIGNSVTSIGDHTFSGCSGFTGSLTIGDYVTTIGNSAFYRCSGFTGSLTIGDSVTTIGNYAFVDCSGFTGSLTIGNSVTSIGYLAFSNCSGFTGSLTIGDSVISIGESAFNECSGFNGTLTIGDSVTTIGVSAFFRVRNITSLWIESKDLKIGVQAFYGMDALQTITCNSLTPPECTYSNPNNNIFSSYTPQLYVPQQAIEKYRSATEWEKFTNIKPISEPATSISLNKSELNMIVGESETLIASLLPDNATETAEWSVLAEPQGCVTVEDGKVTAVAPGSATVTATAGEFSAFCKVTVTQPASEIVIDFAASGIEGDDLTLNVGETTTISVTVTPANSTDKLSWTSSNTKIATVDAEGKITAVKAGGATITVTTESGKSASLKVTVLQPASDIAIDFEGEVLTLNVGETQTLKATVTPTDSTDKLTWSSSNTEIATVDAEGKITAVKAGEATVTVTTESDKSASLKVTVLQPASDIVIDFEGDNLTLNVGESQTLKATVTPTDSTDKLTWSSSNTEIATVDSEGKITAVKAGEATVTVTTESGKSASLKVTVLQPVEDIVIDFNGMGISGDELEMHVGDSKEIVANVNPEDASDKSLTFVSADTEVATVNEDGIITAVALGNTTITITAGNGVSATLKVSVIATPTTSITLNLSEVSLEVNETVQMIATVMPDDATDKTVTWSSVDEAVATVDADGLVKAVSVGTTTITATTVDGLTAECSVTVTEESGMYGIYDNGLRVSVRGSVITVSSAGDKVVRIMAADGKPVFTAQGDCHANVLPGFYLVVVGDNVTKVVAKY